MSHSCTNSDDEQLFAAIQGGAEEQNTDGANENKELDAAAATNQEYVKPTDGVTAKILADVGTNNQSKPDFKTSKVDPRHTHEAETEVTTNVDYMNNPDFANSSGQTMAQRIQRKKEIFSQETKAPGVEHANRMHREEYANRMRRKQKILSRESGSSKKDNELTSQKSSAGKSRSAAMATRPGVFFVADTNNVVRRGKQILSREGGAAGVEDGQDYMNNPDFLLPSGET
eukprot:CAMPEP_0116036676 /NCGR_PEP_ID=MMETSP0321-20121206/21398_1 /TAXON_ID=163516 /ORGANISM="Leptocylindrus danicus var. danicus, Strain B650" /LENGTH=228 /DNA_ID=CAMNT_0003514331 /DNA_START=41 /DNA_END=723 /DNA_ORIENTATION=+